MKIAVPEVLKPTAPRAPSDEELQEQPRSQSYAKQDSSFADAIEKTVERTVTIAEKTVEKVDPLHIFAPNDIPTRLVMKEGLYSGASDEPYPILECRTLFSFHNLEAKSLENGTSMVIEDSSTGKAVVLIEREGQSMDTTYTIYKSVPLHDDQKPSKTTDGGQSLYVLATVYRTSPKHLQVMMDDETEPTYTIEKAGIPASYATNYFVKQVGVKEEVASTHPWEKGTEMVVVDSGVDATLMYCLAAITNDAQRTFSDKEVQEQLGSKTYVKQESSFADAVDKTVGVVEKGVQVVDPLNIFAPNDIPTRLVMKEGLYSGASYEAYPILECRTLFCFHNLEVKSFDSGSSMVIEDSSTGRIIVLIEREGEKIDAEYKIYKDSPTRDDQESSKMTDKGQPMYLLARVDHASPSEFHVVMDNEVHPTYTMEKAGVPANYATNYFIKQVGVKEEVASTHPWEKNTEMVVVDPGYDVTLMYCLAAIANDGDIVKTRKESFSEMVEKVNPKNLVRKMASSMSSKKQLKQEQQEFDEQEELSDEE